MYVGPVPEGRHMFVFQAWIHCHRHCHRPYHCYHLILWHLCHCHVIFSRPIRQIQTRSLRRIWSASPWFSSLAHTDPQVWTGYKTACDILGTVWSERHTFHIFRIHSCWLLCEHWLHRAWVERDAPLPSSLGKTPAEHLGHESQVLFYSFISGL